MRDSRSQLASMVISALVWSLFASVALYQGLYYLLDGLIRLTHAELFYAIGNAVFWDEAGSLAFWGIVMLSSAVLCGLYLRRFGVLGEVLKKGQLNWRIAGWILLLFLADHAFSILVENVTLFLTGEDALPLYKPGYEFEMTWDVLPADMFLGWIAAPIAEEFVFRGLVMGVLLARGWNPILVVVIASALFTITHTQYYLSGLAMVFASGCLFGLLRLRSGGLLAPMIAHTLLNASITCFQIYDLINPPEDGLIL